jgi:hypothetical protein
MPAKTLTIKAKSKTDLRKKADKAIRDASKHGLIFIKQGYKDSRIKKSKGQYEIEIEVHS